MEGLSFGEQVKIILSRKNMTIKELAEQIQERTGKAMSRQNLTQRLGRDNFQEKDMRMIAAILGCPFRLSIFPADAAEDEKIMEYANHAGIQRRKSRRREEAEDEQYQQMEIFDVEPDVKPEAESDVKSDVKPGVEPAYGSAEVDERDMTIGELYEIHEELKELEESVQQNQAEAYAAAEVKRPAEELHSGEDKEPEEERRTDEELHLEQAQEETAENPDIGEAQPEAQPEAEPETHRDEKPAEKAEKKERFHTGGIFLRRMRRGEEKKKEEAGDAGSRNTENRNAESRNTESRNAEVRKAEERAWESARKPQREVITPESEDFEPVIKHNDAEEDLTLGEMNPYTGREYQTNSVRMHPNRIGYVQVYDRKLHQWTDMTEWAFLGYQERKKALLGKDYEPPIYLD